MLHDYGGDRHPGNDDVNAPSADVYGDDDACFYLHLQNYAGVDDVHHGCDNDHGGHQIPHHGRVHEYALRLSVTRPHHT